METTKKAQMIMTWILRWYTVTDFDLTIIWHLLTLQMPHLSSQVPLHPR
uniref:Uncharacterized protein n=1 Tax=Moniliophthora roreri TaxID=221103 RepID=A0A0W0EYA1_MONRR